MKQDKTIFEILLMIVLSTAGLVFQTFAIWKMYWWFLVPMSLPGLSFFHITGLLLLYAMFVVKLKKDDNTDFKKDFEKLFKAISYTGTFLGFSWIAKTFMSPVVFWGPEAVK